jgi:hypothetical protein
VGFGKKHAFFVLAFTTGLREGLESIVFLVGVISDVCGAEKSRGISWGNRRKTIGKPIEMENFHRKTIGKP